MDFMELTAGPDWQAVDFISDLHLHVSQPDTFDVWQHYMQTTPVDAVFILGDLFEVWVGDDVVQQRGFEYECAQVIAQTAARKPVFFMHGNRDFLVGHSLMGACNAKLLADPCVLNFLGSRWLLSHGDELCIDDVAYMQFRLQVRNPFWQKTFLAKPLAERQTIARSLRQQSDAVKISSAGYADLDTSLTQQWLQSTNACTLIHGHTHKPQTHDLGGGVRRVVLSDWDMQAVPPRAQSMRLSSIGLQRIDLTNGVNEINGAD